MRLPRGCSLLSSVVALLALWISHNSPATGQSPSEPAAKGKSSSCPKDDSGLKLPPGFCATVFADSIGHARHLVVGSTGVVYVNTWSGDYYNFDKVHEADSSLPCRTNQASGKPT